MTGQEMETRDQSEDDDDNGKFDPSKLDFGFDKADFEGLKKAILAGGLGDDDHHDGQNDGIREEDVDKLEKMMRKLQAVREAGADLPEEQRKRMAARAVGEVMKELDV
jgi:hypothetical protein